jgi:hypothetical protein
MSVSLMRLIKMSLEFLPKSEIDKVPKRTRGIYVLYQKGRGKDYEVKYIGMVKGLKTAGIAGRLRKHVKAKGAQWSHVSIFEVWDNISEKEVEELEGLLRHIYRYDPKVNPLNKQQGYGLLNKIRRETIKRGK